MLFGTLEEKQKEKEIADLDVQIKDLELQRAKFNQGKLETEINLFSLNIPEEIIISIREDIVSEKITVPELDRIIEKVEQGNRTEKGFEFNIEFDTETIAKELPEDLYEMIIFHMVAYAKYDLLIDKIYEELFELRSKKRELQQSLFDSIVTESKYKELLKDG